jgi:hypothetical protein
LQGFIIREVPKRASRSATNFKPPIGVWGKKRRTRNLLDQRCEQRPLEK